MEYKCGNEDGYVTFARHVLNSKLADGSRCFNSIKAIGSRRSVNMVWCGCLDLFVD